MNLLDELARTDIAPALLAQVQALIEQQQARLAEKDFKIKALTFELAYYKRVRFGKASEALVGEQRMLFDETVDMDLAAIDEELRSQAPVKPPRKRAGRQPLPPELERIEHRHEPESCQCGQCGADLVKIGEDVSEQLDVEPARFFVHRHIRPQYACRPCETVTAAPIPPAVIDGGMAAVGLLAWIAACKYLDHLPLYRIEQIATRQGVPLARSTLADWIGRIGVALQPLADRLADLLRQHDCLHADETPVRQLDPGSGKTRHAYLWAYRSGVHDGGPPIVVFDYQSSRAGAHVRSFLHGWRGHLMVDDYAGYKAMFADGPTELACLAHIRRKFFDVHAASKSPVAEQALQRIARLYAIEQQGVGLDPPQRMLLREQLALPALAELHAWLLVNQRAVAAGSGTAKAIDHALKRWPALQRYASSGSLPIDNNPVENAIRPIAIGKKNWLFAGSERAGRRAAAIQSLFATARLNGLDPARWLAIVLERLPTCPNSQIDSLLPFPDFT
ncbi:IS66 family transposase [Massilia violaceinigra]|uniref:IS66 family transposase n=1 Tax=Massilia violaceinigra TaxID=2045208 RepID=A0ABY4AAV3_9BURK|nr:IS66 family transposase [Massilia violaceinigra]UOD29979.1 IS66 family transposase [Massilia violaceinigra]UOD30794.1 IS66 family transposase [Massilia violaceinigra]